MFANKWNNIFSFIERENYRVVFEALPEEEDHVNNIPLTFNSRTLLLFGPLLLLLLFLFNIHIHLCLRYETETHICVQTLFIPLRGRNSQMGSVYLYISLIGEELLWSLSNWIMVCSIYAPNNDADELWSALGFFINSYFSFVWFCGFFFSS